MIDRVRVVVGSGFLAPYPEGGGHWMAFLQYLLGLAALGHDVLWLEVYRSSGDPDRDRHCLDAFFGTMCRYGVEDRVAVLAHDRALDAPELGTGVVHGATRARVEEFVRSADLVWNVACALRPPLLDRFRHRVLVDVDPGHLQVSALDHDLGVAHHDAFLTVGTTVGDVGSSVPTLGVRWDHFLPIVHLPMWQRVSDPPPDRPFTSVTQWTWEQLWMDGRVLSVSKRDAYLRYRDLPRRAGRRFELAVNLHPDDRTGDRDTLCALGWTVTDAHRVAGTPDRYQAYVAASRAELSCPKPIHRELRTGWFSDRSAAYLASGRPVVMEETGVSDRLPTGRGIVTFRDIDTAVAGVRAVDGDYARHSAAARAIAEEWLDARRVLPAMLRASSRSSTDARRHPVTARFSQ